ncbi:MAG: hypothetical protein ACXVNN_08500 [Bacteroidia bacterium]
MKKYLLLFIISFFSFVSFSQDIKKQIADLDTAYYHNDFVTAKKLIVTIFPEAESKIKDPKELVEFYGTCGSVFYGAAEFKDAENYFTLASEKRNWYYPTPIIIIHWLFLISRPVIKKKAVMPKRNLCI